MAPREIRFASVCCILGIAAMMGTRIARANLSDISARLGFIIGVMPNFAAAFELSFFAMIVPVIIPPLAVRDGRRFRRFAIGIAVVVFGLIGWEFAQSLFWHYPIDPNDIAATVLGGALAAAAYAAFLRCSRRDASPSAAEPPRAKFFRYYHKN